MEAKFIEEQAKLETEEATYGTPDLTSELKAVSSELQEEKEKLLAEREKYGVIGEPAPPAPVMPSVEIISDNVTEIEEEDEEEEDLGESRLVSTTDGRRTCPACGNQHKYPIIEVEDKSNIIMFSPRMYGKKFQCGECGAEWR